MWWLRRPSYITHINVTLIKLSTESSYPMDRGFVILEETTLIRIEMFHHRIKVIKGTSGPNPCQPNSPRSITEPPDPLTVRVKYSGGCRSPGVCHTCARPLVENIVKGDSSDDIIFSLSPWAGAAELSNVRLAVRWEDALCCPCWWSDHIL